MTHAHNTIYSFTNKQILRSQKITSCYKLTAVVLLCHPVHSCSDVSILLHLNNVLSAYSLTQPWKKIWYFSFFLHVKHLLQFSKNLEYGDHRRCHITGILTLAAVNMFGLLLIFLKACKAWSWVVKETKPNSLDMPIPWASRFFISRITRAWNKI
jgi:hypothetical protein